MVTPSIAEVEWSATARPAAACCIPDEQQRRQQTTEQRWRLQEQHRQQLQEGRHTQATWRPWAFGGAAPPRGDYEQLKQALSPEGGPDGPEMRRRFDCLSPQVSFLLGGLLVVAGLLGIFTFGRQDAPPSVSGVAAASMLAEQPSDPINCSLQSSWSDEVRSWCCRQYRVGCADPSRRLCASSGHPQEWCCETYEARCMLGSPP